MDGVRSEKNHKNSHYVAHKLARLRDEVTNLLVNLLHVASKDIRVIYQHDLFTEVLHEEQFLKLHNLRGSWSMKYPKLGQN